MKKAIAALMLATLVQGNIALAQTLPIQTIGSTISAPTETTPGVDNGSGPTVQEVLLSVCQSQGYGQPCAQTLLGMLWNESANVSTAIGDHGKARGYFQIWYKMHKITVDCAEDLVCSANWTLNHMEAHSYPKFVSYAVQCHNGCNIDNGYAARALRNGKNLWNTPLEVSQDAPIVLPVPSTELALNK